MSDKIYKGRNIGKLAASILIFLVASTQCVAEASCIRGPLNSTNKDLHLVGSALIATTVTTVTNSQTLGAVAAITAGVIREEYKIHHIGRCEWSSMAYDAVGVVTGTYLGGKIISLEVYKQYYGVNVSWRF